MHKSVLKYEGHIIQLGTMVFWFLFWFLNVVDKFIFEPVFLWVGKNRLEQFAGYFDSIGVTNPVVARGFLAAVTTLEILAMVAIAIAIVFFAKGNKDKSHFYFFWGTFMGLVVFSFFTIGDQIFGDRFELLEHTLYWVALVVSWGAYVYFPRLLK